MPLSLCTPGCYWNRNHQKWNEMAGGDNMISLEKDRSNRKNFMELSMCMSAIVCVALVHGEQGWNIGWSVRSAPCRPALMSEWLTGPAAPDGNCQRYSGWLLLLTRLFHPSWALSHWDLWKRIGPEQSPFDREEGCERNRVSFYLLMRKGP